MSKQYIVTVVFCLLFGVSNTVFVQAQQELSAPLYKALNNYIHYSNEMIHAAQIFHDDFTNLNAAFNARVDGHLDTIQFEAERVLTSYDYFTVLPKELYIQIFDENIYIPFEQRGKPLQLVSQLETVVLELQRLRKELEFYIQTEEYRNDQYMAKAYRKFRRVEVLFLDIYALQEKLQWSIHSIIIRYPYKAKNQDYFQVLNGLEQLVAQSKRLLRAVRAKDVSIGLRNECMKMNEILYRLKTNKASYFRNIPDDELSFINDYNRMLIKGDRLMNHTLVYLNEPELHYQNLEHQPNYYFYNDDLLGNYNRYGNGLTILYNRSISYTNEFKLFSDELPPIFELIYPLHPAFDSLRIDSLPDPYWFYTAIEKNRMDSLKKLDSLQNLTDVDSTQNEGPSLEGYATNNLIFLIDISSSMNAENKLPLLKESLEQLLGLMRKEDNITVITYSEKAQMLLPPTSAEEKEKILEVLDQLKVQTTSNADKGLEMAYLVAKESYLDGGNNRIILSTDGNFKIRRRSRRKIRRRARQNIKLSVFYYSEKEYSHVVENLTRIAYWGRGHYSYITRENAEEALLMEAQAVREKSKKKD